MIARRVMRLVALVVCGPACAAAAEPVVTDLYERPLDDFGIVLVDWEGHMANPAITLYVHPPASASFPVTAVLRGDESRLYFDLPSTVGPEGPTRTITFTNASPRRFRLSIFPDRDGESEHHELTIEFPAPPGLPIVHTVPIQVVDQDLGAELEYEIFFDFDQDQSGFFAAGGPERVILQQAARDWAFFLADMNLDPVPAGAQSNWIWDYPLAWTGPPPNGHPLQSTIAYDGFLLYAYGIDTPEHRSGGAPSGCCFHTSYGVELPLRRSGAVSIDENGNPNGLGWFLTMGDDDWWVSGNFINEPRDLHSIALHEFGHALAFAQPYPEFEAGSNGVFDDPTIVDYHGGPVTANPSNAHFEGVIDRESGHGIFGNGFNGDVPPRRRLITKLDLLLLDEVGYARRPTSAFAALSVPPHELTAGRVGVLYEDAIPVSGGNPFYDWTLAEGSVLPPGLALDRFSGGIIGLPETSGTFLVQARVQEYGGAEATFEGVITILPAAGTADVNGDGVVGSADLAILLGAWGANPGHPADIDGDGVVAAADIARLLGLWG